MIKEFCAGSIVSKKFLKVSLVTFLALTLTLPAAWAKKDKDDDKGHNSKGKIKNVIVMIPDGCDETVQTVARWYKGEDLQVDKMVGGGVKIHMADSVITDSAAAATAFACGHKTSDGFVGVGPRTDTLLTGLDPTAEPYAPVVTILEAAKSKGKATGIAVTCRISHATPAAFASHIHLRGSENDITEHMVCNDVDVVFGGGARHLVPVGEAYNTTFGDTWGGKRTDGENLLQVLLDRGYQFVDNRDDMQALSSGKVWGLFAASHMQPDIDRQHFALTEPSLAEMVAKAIELLSQDKDGFFLMVEGSQVDWAGHANDPIYMVTDFLAFDDAVKVACDFADQDGQTLVMAYPDHNTGGMKIGHYYTPMGYTKTKVEDLVDPLMGMYITSAGLVAMMENDYSIGNIQEKVGYFWALGISEEEAQEILDYQVDAGVSLDYALSQVISKNHTVIGWTTHGHNGETVPLWIHGADAPAGIIDNTELAFIAADAMNVSLNKLTEKLYVDISEVTSDYVIDTTDPENPVLKIEDAEFSSSKDYMSHNGHIVKLPGINVYAPITGKFYIAKSAVKMLRRFGIL